uniref:Large ribosomal subunit protein bL20m n=1 Tax=Lynceus sp. MCZ IZ 141354 TaxID=1930659 RepID=A0A9N6WZ22_9CRUS|nr:EOG090X0H9C [Lynceus sp. MCZ IZ 141354]
MVNLTNSLMNRARGFDKFWKRRRVFRMTAHFYGRKRNVYSIAIKYLHRALAKSTKARQFKKRDFKELWNTRLEASTQELGSSYEGLVHGLSRCHIALNRQSLTTLAIWEPRTFKALTKIATLKVRHQPPRGLQDIKGPLPDGIITRGML